MTTHATTALAFLSGIALAAVLLALICSVLHDIRRSK